MKKFILILFIFFLIPSSLSWTWQGHQAVAESTFYQLPSTIRSNLNLSLIKYGSIVPDKIFHDNVLHHYPPSLNKTLFWLDIALKDYNSKNYNNASYALGVATHYISDSYSAPHYISKEPWNLHSLYEKQATYNYIKPRCSTTGTLEELLEKGSQQKETWQIWLKDNQKRIPQNSIKEATQSTYSVILNLFNAKCPYNHTNFKKHQINFQKILIYLMISLTLTILYLILLKVKNPFKFFSK